MKNAALINILLRKGNAAKEKVSLHFSNLSLQQLNWQPSPASWSIAQCLGHLVESHNAYFDDLEKIVRGEYKRKFWEKYSPFTGLWGKLFKDQMQENIKRKMKAPDKILPKNNRTIEIIEQYHKSIDTFLEYISKCRNIDIDKTIITSPITSVITYRLSDALQFLISHEHRHINQAIEVKMDAGFPGSV
jgi:uncharacterized damage-inducible protein DinB